MDIAPSSSAGRQRQLNHMLDEVAAHLDRCREIWWESKLTTCLENKWLLRVQLGDLAAVDGQQPGAKQVRSAHYDVVLRMTTLVFSDGTKDSIPGGA
jgi:hypothetical protein